MFKIIEKNIVTYGFSLHHICVVNGIETTIYDLMNEVRELCIGKGRCKKCFKNKINDCSHIYFPCRCAFHSFLFSLENNIDDVEGLYKAYGLLTTDSEITAQFLQRLDVCSHIPKIGIKFINSVSLF